MATPLGDLIRKYNDRKIILGTDLLSVISQIQYITDIIAVSKGRNIIPILGVVVRKLNINEKLDIRDYISIITQIQQNSDDINISKGLPKINIFGNVTRNVFNTSEFNLEDLLTLIDQIQINIINTANNIIIQSGNYILVTENGQFIATPIITQLLIRFRIAIGANTVSLIGPVTNLISSGIPYNQITFNNPSYTHKVWRSGTQYTGTIKVPTGYGNITWQIIDYKTRVVVTSGTGVSVTNTFTYTTGCNVYDLKVNCTKTSFPNLERIMSMEITCMMPTFTEQQADLVIDLSKPYSGLTDGIGAKDGQWIDRPGYKIFLKNSSNGASILNMYYWRSTNDANPVRIQGNNNTIQSTTFNFQAGPNYNCVIDGCVDETVQYGIKLIKSLNGTDQNLLIGSANGSTNTQNSYRITVCGIYTENLTHSVGGAAGIQVGASNSIINNYNTYILDQPLFFNCLTNWTAGEGYYFMHFTDQPDGTGRAFNGASNGIYFRLNASNTANEGFQFGSNFTSDVALCNWINTGLGQGNGQRNVLQWSPGNRDCTFFQNYMEGANDFWTGFTGRRGKDAEMFANIAVMTGPAAIDGVCMFFRIDQNDTYSSFNWNIHHNTFIFGNQITNEVPLILQNTDNTVTTIANKFNFVDNIIVNPTSSTQYSTVNGFNIGNLVVNNYQVLNGNDVMFFNLGNKDTRIASLTSTAFGVNVNITYIHPLSLYDFRGYKRILDIRGADAAIELQTGVSIVRNITSVANSVDVNVSNGTLFATVVSSYLPNKVLVTNSDGSSRMCTITWIQGSYNKDVGGTYVTSGTITLPSDITNSGNLSATINIIVGVSLSAVNLKINLFTGIITGWFATGSNSPSHGAGIDEDYGEIIIDGVHTGIGIRAKNISGATWTGTNNQGGTSTTNFPAEVRGTYWYSQGTNGARFEIYEITAGTLTGRLFTIKFLGSRASLGVTRTTQYTEINGGQLASYNVAISSSAGNTAILTLTHCTVVSSKIIIEVKGIAPNDTTPATGLINGITLDSE